MAAIPVQTVVATGTTPNGANQIPAWGSANTISADVIGSRGVMIEVINTSGSDKELRISDPGRTPSGNPASGGYIAIPVPDNSGRRAFVGPANIDGTVYAAKIGADTSHADFVIAAYRY